MTSPSPRTSATTCVRSTRRPVFRRVEFPRWPRAGRGVVQARRPLGCAAPRSPARLRRGCARMPGRLGGVEAADAPGGRSRALLVVGHAGRESSASVESIWTPRAQPMSSRLHFSASERTMIDTNSALWRAYCGRCGRRDSNPHGLRPRGPKPRRAPAHNVHSLLESQIRPRVGTDWTRRTTWMFSNVFSRADPGRRTVAARRSPR